MTAQEFTNSIISLKGNLQKYALSLTLDRDNALDLVQDTFLKAIQNQDKFVDATNLKAVGIHDNEKHLHQQLPPEDEGEHDDGRHAGALLP
ncbi:MAG: hypothetical protein MZV63_59505 [Marinilabiliales bacterium]|nr:hypothetical protein [Marinilabiliales bacterium]